MKKATTLTAASSSRPAPCAEAAAVACIESLACAMSALVVEAFASGQSVCDVAARYEGLTPNAIEFALRDHLLSQKESV